MAKPQAASKAQQAAAVQSSKPATKQLLPNTPRGWMQRAKQALAPKAQPAKPAPVAKSQPTHAPKAARPTAPKQDPPERWGKTRSPKDLPPAGSNGIESKVVKEKFFGLGGREVHVNFAPPADMLKQHRAGAARPPQPGQLKPPAPPRDLLAAHRAKPKAPAPKGTIFDNDRAAHARNNGLPAPKSLAGKSGPNRPGAGKSGPSKGGRGR